MMLDFAYDHDSILFLKGARNVNNDSLLKQPNKLFSNLYGPLESVLMIELHNLSFASHSLVSVYKMNDILGFLII